MRKKLIVVCFLLSLFFFVCPAGASLIVNGDFESGLTGWQSSYNVSAKGSWADVDPIQGDRQAVLSNMGFSPASLSQDFSVDAGTSFSISFDYNLWACDVCGGNEGDDFVVSLTWDGGTYFEEILRYNIDSPTLETTTSGWKTFTFELDEVFEEDTDLSIMFELDNFKSPMQLAIGFVDNVKIEQITGSDVPISTPVPPAFLLLMSGVAGLFTVKKKLNKHSA